jgi:hypothetical protein
MTDSSRLAYDDFSTPEQMRADCRATGRNLHLPRLERAARAAVANKPVSLHFEDFPREVPKRDIEVSEASARLANAMHFHLD